MKYILIPIWTILVLLYTIVDLIIFISLVIFNFSITFKKSKVVNWKDWTENSTEYDDCIVYDKNVYETFIRRITMTDYKNKK